MPLTPEMRKLRDLRSETKEQVVTLEEIIQEFDKLDTITDIPAYRKRVAELTSAIERSKDSLKHFTLGMKLNKPAKGQPANPKDS
jgi:hypothetical protein